MLLYQPPYNDSFTSDVYCSNIPTYRVPSLQLWEQDLITLVHIPKTACLVNNIQVIYACLLCCDVNICVPEIHPTIQALSLVTCRGGRTMRKDYAEGLCGLWNHLTKNSLGRIWRQKYLLINTGYPLPGIYRHCGNSIIIYIFNRTLQTDRHISRFELWWNFGRPTWSLAWEKNVFLCM